MTTPENAETGSTLGAIVGEDPAERPDPSTVFELLSDPTRREIVRVLTERTLRDSGRPALSFSELRSQAGVRNGGRFNYHLDRLRGTLVEKVEEGYALTVAGFVFGWLFFADR